MPAPFHCDPHYLVVHDHFGGGTLWPLCRHSRQLSMNIHYPCPVLSMCRDADPAPAEGGRGEHGIMNG